MTDKFEEHKIDKLIAARKAAAAEAAAKDAATHQRASELAASVRETFVEVRARSGRRSRRPTTPSSGAQARKNSSTSRIPLPELAAWRRQN